VCEQPGVHVHVLQEVLRRLPPTTVATACASIATQTADATHLIAVSTFIHPSIRSTRRAALFAALQAASQAALQAALHATCSSNAAVRAGELHPFTNGRRLLVL